MGTFIFKWRHLALVSSLIALVLTGVACGRDAEEDRAASDLNSGAAAATSTSVPVPPMATATSVPTVTVEPTATFAVIKVTPSPIPTETPIPTATPVPPTPTAAINIDALYDLGPERPFPEALLGSSDRLPRDEAAAIWDAFLGNTRVIGELDGPNVLDLCSNHTGKWLIGSDRELKPLTGMTFTWEVKTSVAGRWNEPHLVMTSDQFGSLIYGNHLIHITSADSLYTVLLPIGGLTGGEPRPGREYQTIMTNQAQDHNYEFGDTSDTTCAR